MVKAKGKYLTNNEVTFIIIILSLYSYGFVSYSTVEEAKKAADSLNDTVLDGRALYINFDLRGETIPSCKVCQTIVFLLPSKDVQ